MWQRPFCMYRQVAIAAILLIGAARAPSAFAIDVTTYGVGLKSCKAYLEARQGDNGDQVAFVDWLSGYFSGVNKTSTHRNNFFGLGDLTGAMNWLDEYCNARPLVRFAEAVSMLLYNAKPGPAAHAIEATSYGSADKSCDIYVAARKQRDVVYSGASAEFTRWLGGYLSGLNATSLSTDNVLGKAELADAVSWLESYCRAHPLTTFAAAVQVLTVADHPLDTDRRAVSR